MTEPTTARIIKVMIASPGEASEERQAIPAALNRWNGVHGDEYGVRLQPVMWETDATPGLEGRPQGMINKQLVSQSHLLIAIFRSRIGSPTEKERSGTVEEIMEFKKAGKHVLLYFYQGEVAIRKLDANQFSQLTEFKKEMFQAGLVGDYSDISQLREHLAYHLTSVVQRLVGPRTGGIQSDSATASEPRRKRAGKRATGGQTPTRKSASLSGARGTREVVDSTGDSGPVERGVLHGTAGKVQ